MRIIHTADLHLDSSLSAYLKGEKGKKRSAELRENFRRLVNYAKENEVSAVLIAGDMFDRSIVTGKTEDILIYEIQNAPDINFYVIKGNHDEAVNFWDSPDIPANLIVFDEIWKSCPLSDKTDIYAAEIKKNNVGSLVSSLLTNPDKINIVMLHGQISDYASAGKEECIPLNNLKNKNIDYLALGHIHSYKAGEIDSRGIYVYPGCLEGRGFDEDGEKGFVLVDIDEDSMKVNHTFVPFAGRRVYVEEVDVSGCSTTPEMEDRINSLSVIKNHTVNSDDMLKIILTGKLFMDVTVDTIGLNEHFKDDYFVFKIEDNTEIFVDYESFEADLSLKGEFVRLVKNEDLPDSEKSKIIQMGVELLKKNKLEFNGEW